jgi:hypothetical protein
MDKLTHSPTLRRLRKWPHDKVKSCIERSSTSSVAISSPNQQRWILFDARLT